MIPQAPASTFVLVPGAWHGGWCFREVARLLRQAGHAVHVVTLTGSGERRHLVNRTIDLELHIQDVIGVLEAEELADVHLLGHSYAGFVISGVADKCPGRIGTLLYLDAIVPADGEMLIDHLSPEFTSAIHDGAERTGDGYLVPIPTMDFLGVGSEHAAWVQRRLTPQPIGTALQRIRLGANGASVRKVYIHCDHPSIEPTHRSKRRVLADPAWSHYFLQTGHDPFVTAPGPLCDVLKTLTYAKGTATDS